MKIKCPHCSRTLSLSDDKLREYFPDPDTQAEDDSQPGRQLWIMIIVVAAALAGTVGFGGGALLTRPTRNRTAAKIESVRATAAEEVQQATRTAEQATKNAQQATAKTRQLEAKEKALYLRIANLTKENKEAWATVKKERMAASSAQAASPETSTNSTKPDELSVISGNAISALRVSTPFFGVYLGETLHELSRRHQVRSSTWGFTDSDHPGEVYDVLKPPEGVSALRATVFRDRVYGITVEFADTTETNLDAIRKRLEVKYGKNTTGGLTGSLFGEATFAPTLDDVDVWIAINRDVGIGEPDTLKLTYRHSILAKIVQGVLEHRKTARVGDNL